MIVTALLPTRDERPIPAILDRLASAAPSVPFSAPALDLLADLSRRILQAPTTAREPDAVALGYWLRPAHLRRLMDRRPPLRADVLRVPAGLVFHVPPANVDTMFVYSWAVGLLAGNRQLIRLSRRRGELADRLLPLIDQALAAFPALADGTAFVEYDHDDAITAAISGRCDLRVIWGGDATVAAIRAVALSPHAKEIVFADRLSLALLSAPAVQALGPEALAALAGRFFNDVLTFDQRGCSSPRHLVWIGPSDQADAADGLLMAAVAAEIARRGYQIPMATALEKYAVACRAAIRGAARSIWMERTDWMQIDLGDGPVAMPAGAHPGGGLIYRSRIDSLAQIAPVIDRSVQTVTHFGVDRAELDALAGMLAGKGVDRLVPVGEALAFEIVWDGYDLFDEFTRCVVIRS